MALQHITYAIEQSIVNYLSSSFSTPGTFLNQLQISGSNVQFNGGQSNNDKQETSMGSPVVTVKCTSATEVTFNSRVYDMNVAVECAEIAADTQILGQLPEYIFNEFNDSITGSINFTNNVISVYQVKTNSFDQNIEQDSILSIGNFSIIGGLK